MTKNKVSRIIKAKLSSKENMPDWYHERKEICRVCPHNSANVEKLSAVDILRISHNLGKPACLICTCGIDDKCSDPQSQCPDTPPRWLAQESSDNRAVKIKKESGIAKLNYDVVREKYILDYGEIGRGLNTKVVLVIEDDEHISKIQPVSTCGCTVTKLVDGKVTITYGNNIVGAINKTVKINYEYKGGRKVTEINLKGRIK